MSWGIRNVIPLRGFVIVFGPSGCGKSLLVLDMCAKLVIGAPWFGNPVASNLRCMYIALEGKDGLRKRVEGWQIANEMPFPDHVSFMCGNFSLLDKNDVKRLAKQIMAIGGFSVIVIDTLNRAAVGAEENNSRDMGMIIGNATLLQNLTGGLVILVHHSGKDETRGVRGHSSLHAAADAIIAVTRNGDGVRSWKVVKSKDGVDGESREFEIVSVEVGTDEFGLPMTAGAIRETDKFGPSGDQKSPLGKNQAVVYERFRELAAQNVYADPETFERIPFGISFIDLLSDCRDLIEVSDNGRRTERTTDAIKSLIKTEHFVERDGLIYLST